VFSVLMAAYNAEATIAESLDSLLEQTFPEWESIVVDDGSTDRTLAIANGYASRDARIKVLTKANGGTGSARNAGAAQAIAEVLSLLDADDKLAPDYFERMHRFIEGHPGYGIYSCDGYVFSADEAPRPDDLQPDSEIRSYSAEDLLVRNRFRVLTCFRRGVFELVGGFDEDRHMAMEDYDFWLRALLRGAKHIHDPERLWLYRVSATQKTSDPLVGARADALMFDRLLAGGRLDSRQMRLARATRRRIGRWIRTLEAQRERWALEARLAAGDLRGARRKYLSAWRGYGSKAKYLLGLPVLLVSPRAFSAISGALRATEARGRDGVGSA